MAALVFAPYLSSLPGSLLRPPSPNSTRCCSGVRVSTNAVKRRPASSPSHRPDSSVWASKSRVENWDDSEYHYVMWEQWKLDLARRAMIHDLNEMSKRYKELKQFWDKSRPGESPSRPISRRCSYRLDCSWKRFKYLSCHSCLPCHVVLHAGATSLLARGCGRGALRGFQCTDRMAAQQPRGARRPWIFRIGRFIITMAAHDPLESSMLIHQNIGEPCIWEI